MMKSVTFLAVIAIIATIGTVTSIIGAGLSVQQAHAATCNQFFDGETGETEVKCSSSKSFEKSNGFNSHFHCKNCN